MIINLFISQEYFGKFLETLYEEFCRTGNIRENFQENSHTRSKSLGSLDTMEPNLSSNRTNNNNIIDSNPPRISAIRGAANSIVNHHLSRSEGNLNNMNNLEDGWELLNV